MRREILFSDAATVQPLALPARHKCRLHSCALQVKVIRAHLGPRFVQAGEDAAVVRGCGKGLGASGSAYEQKRIEVQQLIGQIDEVNVLAE